MSTAPRTITTRHHWDNLPVGTIARVLYFETGEEETEDTMFVTRVDGDFMAAAGPHYLAGGRHWSNIWEYQQGATALDPSTLFETAGPVPAAGDAITAAKAEATHLILRHRETVEKFNQTPYGEYVNLPPSAHPAPTAADDIVDRLVDLGWQPPASYPEGVQVWTVSGIPNGGVSDGTQAYLSLPDRKGEGRFDFQDRSDIWLKDPQVTVNFELPRRRVD